MADYIIRTETITRTIFELTTPTNWVEVEKAMAGCREHLAGESLYDDSVTVESGGEAIRFVITEIEDVR